MERHGPYNIHIIKTDNKFPYKIELEKDGVRMKGGGYYQTREEAQKVVEKLKQQITKDEDPKTDIEYKRKLNNAGYQVNGVMVTKNSVHTSLRRQDIIDGDYVALIKYHDELNSIIGRLSQRKDVFYSDISGWMKYRFKNVKQGYKSVLYSAIVDSLRHQGINVHS